jgi:PAS domain S-box-containing protein
MTDFVPALGRLRLRFMAALLVAAALVLATEWALRDALAQGLADPRVEAAVGEQRMLAERIAQTALRLAEAPAAERAPLYAALDQAVARSSEILLAFRSVDAPAAARRARAPETLPEWRELETVQRRVAARSEALGARLGRTPAPSAKALAEDASTLGADAAAFGDATRRWLAAQKRRREQELRRERDVHRALAGGSLAALGAAWLFAFEPALRALRRRSEAGSDARYRTLVERCPNAVVVSVNGWLAYANPAAAALFRAEGPGALVGTPAHGLFHPDDRPAARERLEEALRGRTFRRPLEFRVLRLDGTEGRALLHLAPVEHEGARGVEALLVDVTEQRGEEARRQTLETRLRAAERVESLALMAGGVAHDFSNLLTAIIANAEMLRLLVRDDAAQTATVEEVLAAANTAAELVEQLLTYAGGGAVHMEAVDLGELAGETLRLLRRRVPERVELRLLAEPGVPAVRGDRSQLRQIVLNLVLNAAEAIAVPPGQIEVRVGRIRVDRAFLDASQHDPEVPPGDYVLLEVSDTGSGMDAATRARIFDPFFSRRRAGRGLGLAAVLGIVRRHRGAIAVESEPGSGALLRVVLPPAR